MNLIVRQNAVNAVRTAKTKSLGKQVRGKLARLIPDIRKTAELIQEVNVSSQEQALGIGQINSSVLQLDQIVQKNTAAAEHSVSLAGELSDQSEIPGESVSWFQFEECKNPLLTDAGNNLQVL